MGAKRLKLVNSVNNVSKFPMESMENPLPEILIRMNVDITRNWLPIGLRISSDFFLSINQMKISNLCDTVVRNYPCKSVKIRVQIN